MIAAVKVIFQPRLSTRLATTKGNNAKPRLMPKPETAPTAVALICVGNNSAMKVVRTADVP